MRTPACEKAVEHQQVLVFVVLEFGRQFDAGEFVGGAQITFFAENLKPRLAEECAVIGEAKPILGDQRAIEPAPLPGGVSEEVEGCDAVVEPRELIGQVKAVADDCAWGGSAAGFDQNVPEHGKRNVFQNAAGEQQVNSAAGNGCCPSRTDHRMEVEPLQE